MITETMSSMIVKPAMCDRVDSVSCIVSTSTFYVPIDTAFRLSGRATRRRRRLSRLQRRLAIAADAERHGTSIVQRYHSGDGRRWQTDIRQYSATAVRAFVT